MVQLSANIDPHVSQWVLIFWLDLVTIRPEMKKSRSNILLENT